MSTAVHGHAECSGGTGDGSEAVRIDAGVGRPCRSVPGERIAIVIHGHAECSGETGDGSEVDAVAR